MISVLRSALCSSRPFTLLLLFLSSLAILNGCKQKNKSTGALVYSDGSAEFNKIIDKATQMHDSGYAMRSLHFLDSGFNTIQPKNVLDIFHYYYFWFDHYNNHAEFMDHAKATLYSDSMISLMERNNLKDQYQRQYGQALFSKGDALFMAKNYNEAYKYFYQAKTIIKDKLDPCALAGYSYRLAMVLYKQERFQEAAYYFKDAFGDFGSCPQDFAVFYRRQEILDNIALCYYKDGLPDSAMSYYNTALKYIEANFNNFPAKSVAFKDKANAVIYGNMAMVYNTIGDRDKAIALLHKSIAINAQKGFDPVDAQLNRLRLASIYYDMKNIDRLKNTLLTVSTTNDSIPNRDVRMGLYNMMWKYYDMQKDADSAFTYLLKYHRLKDSIDVQMRSLRETDLNEHVKNLDKQYQISILEKNNDLKRTYLLIALLGAVLSAIIFFLIFYNWRKTRKNFITLTHLNDQVNDQKRELEHLLKKLEASHTDKDRVLRAVAHDIRNPIAAISSLADLLAQEGSGDTDEQKELIGYIKNSCVDAMALTKDILEAADPLRAETLIKEEADMRIILPGCIEMLRLRAAEKKQRIDLQMPDAPVHALINKEKMRRVISNLVTNAIKFSPEQAQIDVKLETSENEFQISVHDRGIGIPENIKSKVFDMFTDAKRPGTSGEKPFGLGLSIAKQIVEAHNGRIWFRSDAGKGATFYICLPLTAK